MRALIIPLVLGVVAACGPSRNGAGECTDAEHCDNGPCTPGDTRSCYEGHSGTEGVGPCTGGSQTCLAGGNWGNCEGEVLPASETCGDNVDNNCNGMTDEDVDADGDGFTSCGGDCCDSTECSNPAAVNPNAFEVPGDNVDNDCDGMVDNAIPLCDTGLASNSSTAMDYAKAIDLCQTATMNDHKWGVIDAQFTKSDGTGSPDAKQRSIRPKFGTNVMPKLGSSLMVISSGAAAAKGDTNPAFVAPEDPSFESSNTSGFPADFFAANNNKLPNAPGCPDLSGNMANDPIMLTLKIRVPSNARSFTIKSNFYSSEFPEYTCSQYNDFFVILLDSTYNGTPANPADKNLAFYSNNGMNFPVGVNLAYGNTGLFTECKNGTTGCAPLSGAPSGQITTCVDTIDLAGTGMDDVSPEGCGGSNLVGGATGWLTTTGNVVPGEVITLRIAIWDTSDHVLDSTALIDSFEWSVDGSDPGTVIGREVAPFQPVSQTTGLAIPAE